MIIIRKAEVYPPAGYQYNMPLKEQLKKKRWIIRAEADNADDGAIRQAAQTLGIHETVARLLALRGYRTAEEMRTFLCMENEMLCDPFDMKDMEAAVERIARAVETKEKITVFGDYDVDGVTSVCTLYLYLKSLGADVSYYIPNRATDGYGVTCGAVEQLAKEGTKLIITVDTGITAKEECSFAAGLGVDFVITDHHECHADLPAAVAVVNPHRPDCPYPFKDLAGVGVVFKLLCGYEERRSGEGRYHATLRIFDQYIDLVAIGTIADVMPIRQENRIIVSRGLAMMEKHMRTGLLALTVAANSKGDPKRIRRPQVKITSNYIGYTLAPRINAAGRILSATMAVELFLEEDYDRALVLAEKLCQANRDRQNEENKIIREAIEKLEPYADPDQYPFILLDADNWHHGVIGIVASRITERLCRPSILISFEGMTGDKPSPEDVGKGSGRSVKGLNLVDALCHCQEYLVKFGGHELAAGLSVKRENLPALRDALNRYARENLTEDSRIPTMEADMEILFSDLTLPLAEGLGVLEPYGVGNPVPVFVSRDMTVLEVSGVSDKRHTRFVLGDGNRTVNAMFFGTSPASLGVGVGDCVDALFSLDVNEWMGRRSVQMILRDIRLTDSQSRRQQEEEEIFERVRAGAAFTAEDGYLPVREDFTTVYRILTAAERAGESRLSYRQLLSRAHVISPEFGYVKERLVLLVFSEMNIVSVEDEAGEGSFRFRIPQLRHKADLEKSCLLRRLRTQSRMGDAGK